MKSNISGAHNLLKNTDETKINEAVASFNLLTTGQIHVHIDKDCDIDLLDRAAELFDLLQLNKKGLHNSILIYISKREKQFAIIGDDGINKVVPAEFWKEIADNMTIYFKSGDFVKGVMEGIESAGKKLQQYFPA